MINWIKNEIQCFKSSRTIRIAYAKKLAGLITLILANISYFESSVTPAQFGTALIVLGFIDNHLRKITSTPL